MIVVIVIMVAAGGVVGLYGLRNLADLESFPLIALSFALFAVAFMLSPPSAGL